MSEELYGPRPAPLLPIDTSPAKVKATVTIVGTDLPLLRRELMIIAMRLKPLVSSVRGISEFTVKIGGN